MVICTVEVNEKSPQTIVIGRRGTYNTQEIVFDIGYLIDAYGAGTAVLAIKRSQDSSAYPTVITQEDTTLTWTVSETDTYYKGAGECELMWYVDGGLAKTIIYPLVVMRDILSTSEKAPDAYQTWVDDLTALGAETLENAQNAAQSASDAESAKDDAVAAKEAAEAELEKFTTPTASATTLSAGSKATAKYSNGNFAFGIPKGDTGDPAVVYELQPSVSAIKYNPNAAAGSRLTPSSITVRVFKTVGGTRQTATVSTLSLYAGSSGTSAYNTSQVSLALDEAALEFNQRVQAVAEESNVVAQITIPIISDGATGPQGPQGPKGDKGDPGASDAGNVTYDPSVTYPDGSAGKALTDQKNAIDNKAPVIINSISGAIVTCEDGANGMPIHHLVASIEPVQDLHGYDRPWPAGGGKNLLPMTVDGIKALNNVTFTENSCVINGITFTILTDDDGNVTGISCDGTASAVTVFWIGSMQLASGDAIKVAANTSVTGEIFFRMSGPGKGTYTVQVSSGQTYTATSDIELFGNIRIGNNQTVSNKVFYPVVCKSTETDTTFEPYSNICPISGWTGLSGKRTGKNLYQMTLRSGYTVTIRGVTFTVLNDGTISATGTNDGTGSSIIAFPISIPAGNYYYTVGSIPGAVIGSLDAYIWDGTINARAKKWNGTANVDTAGEEKLYELQIVADHVYAFNLRVANGVSVDNLIFKPMITEATESSAAFEPYAGTPISVNWQGTAGTVYVGTLDVVTGALTVTDAEIASYNGETLPSTWISDRDVYAAGTTPTIGAQVVYKIAEPQTYQLDPVTITTLLGNNVIWTDVGPVTVEYPADTTIVVSDVKNAISQKQDATSYVTLSGTIVTQTGTDNTMYLCGELAELTFTAPATGQTAIRFTSGTTPTVATFSGVTWLNGFDPGALEASKTYEINILNGLGCAAWT